MKASCIPHSPRERFLRIRKSFVDVCEGNACAAGVLAVLEYWTNTRLSHAEQARSIEKQAEKDGRTQPQDQGTWVYRTKAQLQDDLCGMWGRGALDSGITLLLDLGLIEQRQDPANAWNRTLQYKLSLDRLLPAIAQHLEPDNALGSQIEPEEPANGSARESTADGQLETPDQAVDSEKTEKQNGGNSTPGAPLDDLPPDKVARAEKFCRWLCKKADEEPPSRFRRPEIEAAIELLDTRDAGELRGAVEWGSEQRWWSGRVLTATDLRRNWRKLRAEWRAATKNGGGGNGSRPDREQERRDRTERRLRGESL